MRIKKVFKTLIYFSLQTDGMYFECIYTFFKNGCLNFFNDSHNELI